MISRRFTLAVAGTAAAVLMAGCSGGAPAAEEDQSITFWTPQVTPARIAAQEAVADRFEEQTGISVEVVPLGAADQNQALVTGAASGDVPDVILHAPDQTAAWSSQGLLDNEAAGRTVDALGRQTFNERALQLVTVEDGTAAVPSDGWVHLIVYRTDLLEQTGLAAPTSLTELADVAEAIAAGGTTGAALGTQSGTPSGTEAVESIFQTTGCQLITETGEVSIGSAECTTGAEQFGRLAESSKSGQFDVTSARATYLAGQAGMLLFSTHILDELAGLDPDNPLTCEQCEADPTFLVKNSGFITVLDENHPSQYGSTLNYGIPTGANAEAAQRFIEFSLGEGYVDTLATAAEGRLPLRTGTPEAPNTYLEQWSQLDFGVDRSQGQSIADVYGDEIVTDLADGMGSVSRWGFGTPYAALEGNVFSQNLLSQKLELLYSGRPASEVTAAMATDVTKAKDELGL